MVWDEQENRHKKTVLVETDEKEKILNEKRHKCEKEILWREMKMHMKKIPYIVMNVSDLVCASWSKWQNSLSHTCYFCYFPHSHGQYDNVLRIRKTDKKCICPRVLAVWNQNKR